MSPWGKPTKAGFRAGVGRGRNECMPRRSIWKGSFVDAFLLRMKKKGDLLPLSLCGHTSPVESLAFDSAEVLMAAGASAGVIKLWDLEETKGKLFYFSRLTQNCVPD
ncbi:hypothetical protein LguiB_001116 [Lonicera macranthoides]